MLWPVQMTIAVSIQDAHTETAQWRLIVFLVCMCCQSSVSCVSCMHQACSYEFFPASTQRSHDNEMPRIFEANVLSTFDLQYIDTQIGFVVMSRLSAEAGSLLWTEPGL